MYQKQLGLFKDLMPFGGKINQNNQWIKLSKIIDWEMLTNNYRKNFRRIEKVNLSIQKENG